MSFRQIYNSRIVNEKIVMEKLTVTLKVENLLSIFFFILQPTLDISEPQERTLSAQRIWTNKHILGGAAFQF